MIFPIKQITVLLISTAMLSGCAGKMYKGTDLGVNATHMIAQDAMKKEDMTVQIHNGAYIDSTPIVPDQTPGWVQNTVSVDVVGGAFAKINKTLFSDSRVNVHYENTVDKHDIMSFEYSGSLGEALDSLAALSGYAYTIDDNNIYWSKFQTKTYNLAALPGSLEYSIGDTEAHGDDESGDEFLHLQSGHVRYHNLEENISLWDDIQKSIESMLSEDGRVEISESSTTVTIHDYPTNVVRITDYINEIDYILSQQIFVKVQVVIVNLFDEFKSGINWNMVKNVTDNTYSAIGDLIVPLDKGFLLSDAAGAVSPAKFKWDVTGGTLAGSKMLIEALSMQGKVSTLLEPRLSILNNQIGEIKILESISYVASTKTTLTDFGTETEYNPSEVNTGFSLYLLPKVHGGNIFLQVSTALSELVDITNFSSETAGAAPSESESSSIQLPQTSERRFTQRSVVPSGNTIVLTGIKIKAHGVQSSSPFEYSPRTTLNSDNNYDEVIVFITPVIMPIFQDH